MGRLERPVRAYAIGAPRPYAQHKVSVSLHWIAPRKRRQFYFVLTPDNLRYAQVVEQGLVVYDTRSVVPCDMDQWERTNHESATQGRPFQVIRA